MSQPTLPADAARRLRWPLRLTAAGMVGERLWRGGWPLVTVALLALTLWAAGLISAFGIYVIAPLVLLALAAFGWGVRGLSWPREGEVMARLDATLPGQPIAALLDDQAIGRGDAGSQAVWAAHRKRMAARLDGARAVPGDLRVAAADPYGLRLIALIAAIATLGFGALPSSPGGPIGPAGSAGDQAPLASWEGWVEPPAYTGKPSLYLNDQPAGPLAVPVGSRVTLRLYGQEGVLSITEGVSGQDGTALEFDVAQNGPLEITGPEGRAWRISAIGDVPPAIRLDGTLARSLDGGMSQGFVATDDYGVVAGQARFTLDMEAVARRHGLTAAPEPRDPITVDLPMPFRGDRSLIEEVLEEDFSQHPWVGLPVRMVLHAEDSAGQRAESTPLQIQLPGRRFLNPLAAALIEQRRDLLWTRANAPRVAQVLRAVTYRPGQDDLHLGAGTYLKLRMALRRLEAAMQPDLSAEARDDMAQVLWDLAVAIEDGSVGDALARLQRAQERLSEAMRQGATPEELAELMDELRDAMRDYMTQLAQQTPEGERPPPGEDTMQLSQQDLADMMQRIEDLMAEGRTEEAMAALEMLRELMENLQVTQGGQGEGETAGDQAMEGLQDTLRDQQGLSDEAFRDLQEQGGPASRAGESSENQGRDGGQGRGQAHSGEGGEGAGEDAGGDSGDLAARQRALRDQLDAQRRNLPGAGSEEGQAARESLGRAGDAMEGAEQALRDGDIGEALDRQAEAMEAMREGMRNLEDALDHEQAARAGQQGTASGEPGRERNDPLGREAGSGGPLGDQGPLADGEDVYRRAQELMEDIRRRSGEGDRPQIERDYLKRLLDQF